MGAPGGRLVEGDSGIVNVERRSYDIKRSEDGVKWETVFTAPKEGLSWDMAFAVYEKANSVR